MTSQPIAAPSTKPRLRGRTPLRLSFVFLLLAVVAIVVGVVLLVRGYKSTITGFERVSFDKAPQTVSFHDGNYVGYVETPDITDGNVQMRISGAGSGRTVHIEQYGQNAHSSSALTYEYHGRHGQAVFKFRIRSAGRYTVQLASNDLPSRSYMAFGKSIAGTIVGGVLLIFGGVLLGIIFLVLLIVGLVKRSRSKRELANPYGGGFGGPPPGYPQQGYPPSGYPQQGTAQPGTAQPGQPHPGYGQQP